MSRWYGTVSHLPCSKTVLSSNTFGLIFGTGMTTNQYRSGVSLILVSFICSGIGLLTEVKKRFREHLRRQTKIARTSFDHFDSRLKITAETIV